MLKSGDKVKIYQKPLTEEEFEGEAVLVNQIIAHENDKMEYWEVRFYSRDWTETYNRWVRKDQNKS